MIRIRPSIIALSLLTAFGVTPEENSAADDAWRTFRGPTEDGMASSDAKPPLSWSRESNIKWFAPIPGQGWSTPIVANGRVYLTAAIEKEPARESTNAKKQGEAFDLSIVIIDAETGTSTVIPLLEQSGPAKIHNKNSHASSSPLLSGDRIYVHFGNQGTCCIDLDGHLIWKNRDHDYRPVHGNGSSPLLVDDQLIFTCDGAKDPKVVALNATSGELVWATSRVADAQKKFAFCSPTLIHVDGEPLVISPGADCVMALKPKTGDLVWSFNYDGYSVVPKPLFHRGNVIFSTSFDSPVILAIDPTGKGDVTDSHLKWEVTKNAPNTPSMLANDGLVYSISDRGVAICVDANTGDVLYRERIGGNFSASPVLASGRIYLTDEAGKTTVIKTGREYERLSENDLAERTLASLAVVGNAIFLRTAKGLYRIEE